MPAPLAVTLAQLQTLAADPHAPPVVQEGIEALGEDALPDAEIELTALLDALPERDTCWIGWILESTHADAYRSWSLDVAELVLADAVRTLDGGEPRIGGSEPPRKVIAAATRVLAALRAQLPVAEDRLARRPDWYLAWDGHAAWYLSTYAIRDTASPYRALARATVWALAVHGIEADPRAPVDPQCWPYQCLVLAAQEAAETARREALRRDGTELTRGLPRYRRLEEIEILAARARTDRATWCRARLREYLTGTASPTTIPTAGRGRLAVVTAPTPPSGPACAGRAATAGR